ncbi:MULTISPECIES: lysoplasmalogenase [unclassified Oceanispirochaeta]|uniref:lysoplasmalogenase n=1 Tax=unclassified Oceanispirochaeta TaxID=2635722 RepID=UPI000E08DF32|nr:MULTISPECIES: lysoplasmalogenase [unclassified Oceanispirochaeta]MBF9016785.1 lysoplasmalogenase [Oceanispirochaeta sp. M2]NPD72055.1 lysoplasmalogenase [Oceanispirochaeta sp. M1]RDG32499.1 lysoplasmalogenase [Oceanispirochaeta sp. M1]
MLISALPFIVFSLLHVGGEAVKYRPLRYLSKPFLMPSLALFYILNAQNPSVVLIAAIAGGWLGDLFLMIPDKSDKKLFFKLGLAAFLIGHLFYAAAFFGQGSFKFKSVMAPVAALAMIGYCLIIFIKLKPHMGKLFVPITVYIVVIAVMGISTTLCLSTQELSPALTAVFGAFVFIISDTVNAWNRFAYEIPNERVHTMNTYLTGQFLLVLGFLQFIPVQGL